MASVKYSHIEAKGTTPHEKKFTSKLLPSDRDHSTARSHMLVRRQLGRYNRIATQVNSLVENIESGQEGTKALVEWAAKNKASLPPSMNSMLRFLGRAHDSTEKEFFEAHANFVMLSEIISEMSDGAHAKDPSVLATAIEAGKEAARLGAILVQTRKNLELKIGQLQGKTAAAN